jgi:hypothetical protein
MDSLVAVVLRSELESVAPVVQGLQTMRGVGRARWLSSGLSRNTLRAVTSRSATCGWVWGRGRVMRRADA